MNTLKLNVNEPLFVINRKTYELVNFFEGPIADAFEMYILLVSLADQLKPMGSENPAEMILMCDTDGDLE